MPTTAASAPREWRRGDFAVSDDPARLDKATVVAFITGSYWAEGIPQATMQRAIAHSPLVKTAFFASDPNLGRILAAVGNAGIADLDPSKVTLHLGESLVAEHGGRAASYTEEQGKAAMKPAEITVRVGLGRGAESATVWTCDFSYDYVKINADYRS